MEALEHITTICPCGLPGIATYTYRVQGHVFQASYCEACFLIFLRGPDRPERALDLADRRG